MFNENTFEKPTVDFIMRAKAIMDGIAYGHTSIRRLTETTGLPCTTIIRVAAQLVDQGVLTSRKSGDDVELAIRIRMAPPN
ncbi:hypothetical protein [Sphingopyxis sp.]|uniref:hypothetical protein n=1 Tax=Sphingopyxis sp. TaxID=1908224 RepID=UPI003D6D135E